MAAATSSARPGRRTGIVRREPCRPVRLAPAGVDLGVDDAGADRVDPDPLGGDLAGQPEREGVDRPLARRVVDVLARRSPAGWRPRRR